MPELFTEEMLMQAPSVYDMDTIETLKTRITDAEKQAEAYTAERSAAEKNARALRKQIGEMQSVLLRKLQAPAPAKSAK